MSELLVERPDDSKVKQTNPKDAVGIKKAPITTVPLTVLAEVGIGMMEGARKYGRHNYRVDGVRASVYVDAAWRHISKFWEGEDIDPDSGLSHVTKAIASLVVLRDAMINDLWEDDRPPKAPEGFFAELDKAAARVIEKYPDAKPPFTELGEMAKEKKEVSVILTYQLKGKDGNS
jgi:hypothetical protein